MKTKRMCRVFSFMAVLCLGIAISLIYKVYIIEMEYRNGDAVYEQIYQTATGTVIDEIDNEAPGESPEPPDYPDDTEKSKNSSALEEDTLQIDFEALHEMQEEIIAWLYCPDTVINYPITQGTDNEYYLTHLADGTVNRNGCLFIDHLNRNDFSNENTVIYGHHMANGKMFASLVNYADQDYYDEHPVLYMITENKKYRIELFSGYTTTADSSAYTLTFADKYAFADWMREAAQKSDFIATAELTTDDRVVTLSTCAYAFQDARYVVHGKLVEITDNQ